MKKEQESTVEKQWYHSGLKCKVVFVRQSHRCGYVRVPKTHIAYGKSYEDLPIDVHGGLTFGDVHSINKRFQWFGFDCAHLGDRIGECAITGEHFWTLEETWEETNRMAEQFQKLTLKDIIENKLQWMPDWFKSNVRIDIKEIGKS